MTGGSPGGRPVGRPGGPVGLLPVPTLDAAVAAGADGTGAGGTGAGGVPGLVGQREPVLLKGFAAEWPAVRRWTPAALAALDPDLPVQLVVGSREAAATRFRSSTLGEYLTGLQAEGRRPAHEQDPDPPYLKEFDLLRTFPQLAGDLPAGVLFPRRTVTSRTVWIGPAGARTGLHRDLPANLAVMIHGRKRFLVARPGTVERAGLLSAKFDLWARLAEVDLATLAERAPSPGDYLVADLEPGDVLHVPAGWWHEVVNLTPSILLSGFYGPWWRMTGMWLHAQGRRAAHRAGLLGRQECTCHPAG